MPFWVSGSAAMKMISSTSSTSMSGVTFMSALACGISPLTTFSAPKCLCACVMATCLPSVVGGGFFGSVMRPMSSICRPREARPSLP